jgi:hypothetical protein
MLLHQKIEECKRILADLTRMRNDLQYQYTIQHGQKYDTTRLDEVMVGLSHEMSQMEQSPAYKQEHEDLYGTTEEVDEVFEPIRRHLGIETKPTDINSREASLKPTDLPRDIRAQLKRGTAITQMAKPEQNFTVVSLLRKRKK